MSETIQHLAIIMDGNGRWAQQRGLPRWKGHEAGAESVRIITAEACRLGIPYLTLFAFSSENWRRPAREVQILFSLLRRYLEEALPNLLANGIRLAVIGRRDRLPSGALEAIERAERATASCGRLTLRPAIDYGARHEILEAARQFARRAARGEILPEEIDEERFDKALVGGDAPPPDLIIRTAGERRLSNFLLWQAAYSELHFSPRLWPDFREEDLRAALADYRSRARRFGGLMPVAAATG